MSRKKKHRKKNKQSRVKSAAVKTQPPAIVIPANIAPIEKPKPVAETQKSVVQPTSLSVQVKNSVPRASSSKTLGDRLENYLLLMRIDRPIGILLLLWPTYWALWLAAGGFPSAKNLLIFAWGCILMRSAGCVMNDYADRHIDGKVKRTKDRMIVTGKVSSNEALGLFASLCLLAFGLVLLTNIFTAMLSVVGVLLAVCYPFAKRYTYLPQVVLGMAFACSIPMAWSAQLGFSEFKSLLEPKIWLVYLAVVLWAVIYDTFYAMVDRDDDIKIGVKSTAILFGDADRAITAFLQGLMLFTLILIGRKCELGIYYYAGLFVSSVLFVYQQQLIKTRLRDNYFKAFLNNNYVGLAVFVGIAVDLYL